MEGFFIRIVYNIAKSLIEPDFRFGIESATFSWATMHLFGVLHAESMISIRKHSLPEPVRQPVSTRSDRGLPDGTSRSNCAAEYQPPIPRRFDPAQPRVKYRRAAGVTS